LRAKVAAAFAAGALVVSTAMAVLSYDLTRRSLMNLRERNAVRTAYVDATVVHAGLSTDQPDIIEVLRSLDTGSTRQPLLNRGGRWYARSADTGLTTAVPVELQELVSAGQPAVQRVRTAAGPAIVVGIPLPDATAYYVIDLTLELDRTLRVLSLVLTLVAAGTTAAGAALGFYVTRRVLRPLAGVTATAQYIAAGDLTARLDPAAEPELEQLTTAFNRMVERLGQRLERDRRFAADVSHELRSPLQTLAAAASVLTRRRDSLDGRTARAVDLVTGEITRFEALVTDLLELSRGDLPPERERVDIAELARQVCRGRRLPPDIVTVAPDVDPTWHVDRRRMEQAMTNLVDNACRYGGGPVAIRMSRTDRHLCLDVDDDGPGVAPADRESIFDRFVRGHTANARGDHDGTGLGLALVSGHVAAHGGQVYVTDRPGGGARFRVELPDGAP
jgi:signal transduction histidine kinase